MNAPVRAVLEPAYVLHRRPYRDSSLILDVLTAGHGRVALVARGARRPQARLHGVLQPFQPLLASWVLRGEMGTLTAAETREGGGLRGRVLISGFYVNELLLRLLHRHDPHPRLFAEYETVLRGLAAADGQPALRLFEMALLRETGYGLVLDHDVHSGEPIRADAVYYYYPEYGPVRGDDADAAPARRDAVPARVHGDSLLALARGELREAQQLHEAKRLMRAVLDARLGGRPLASRGLFRRGSAGGLQRSEELQ